MNHSVHGARVNRIHIGVLVTLWATIHILLYVYSGIGTEFFDSRGYIKAADYLIAHGRLEAFRQVFYCVPILLIALFKMLVREWLVSFIIFQYVLSGIATLCLYRAGSKMFENANAGFLSALFFLLWWDIIRWNTVVLTESIAVSTTCILLFRLATFKGSRTDYLWITALSVASIFIRPTGVLIAFASAVFVLVWNRNLLSSRPYLRVSMLALLCATSFCGMVFMFSHWDFTEQYTKGNIVTYMDTIEGQPFYAPGLRLDTSGLVLPPESASPLVKILHFVVHNPVHFLKAASLKVFYLVTGVRPYYSFLHNAYSLAWLSLIYLFFLIGFRRSPDRATKSFSLVLILGNCALIAIATVDWDNRFYALMQPVIALFSGGGVATLMAPFSRRKPGKNLLP